MFRYFRRFAFTATKKTLLIDSSLTLDSLSFQLRAAYTDVLQACQEIEQNPQLQREDVVAPSTAEILAYEYGFLPVIADSTFAVKPRPPVVTIMGHVDHGKTTLLDSLRNSAICSTEYGGITQGIGAFSLRTPQGKITFIDTPGHKAFTSMRARGAELTDIVVLVVCAGEGVQAQTVECIHHAQHSEVPIIVALNKIDLPEANPKQVEVQLIEHGLQLDKHGGDTLSVELSAKTRIGLKELEETILFKAELMDLAEQFSCEARGKVIESLKQQGKGTLASVIVKRGTLKVGDIVVVGKTFGRVKSMATDQGRSVKFAEPADAVEISGLNEPPEAGDDLLVVKSMAIARSISARRASQAKRAQITEEDSKRTVVLPKLTLRERNALRNRDTSRIIRRLEYEAAQLQESQDLSNSPFQRMAKHTDMTISEQIEAVTNAFATKEDASIKILLKAQNTGMLQAVQQAVQELGKKHQCDVAVVTSSIGTVTADDLETASEFGAPIFCMDVPLPKQIMTQARKLSIPLKSHKIIYHLLDDVNALITDLTSPSEVEEVSGRAIVKSLFEVAVKKRKSYLETQIVAGLVVEDGVLLARSKLRVVRDGETIAENLDVETLKRFKESVRQVIKGHDCGLTAEKFNAFQEGDEVISYTFTKRKPLFNPTQYEVTRDDVKDNCTPAAVLPGTSE